MAYGHSLCIGLCIENEHVLKLLCDHSLKWTWFELIFVGDGQMPR